MNKITKFLIRKFGSDLDRKLLKLFLYYFDNKKVLYTLTEIIFDAFFMKNTFTTRKLTKSIAKRRDFLEQKERDNDRKKRILTAYAKLEELELFHSYLINNKTNNSLAAHGF